MRQQPLATRLEVLTQDLAELGASVRDSAIAFSAFTRAAHDLCPEQIEAEELGFEPSFYRSKRLHIKLVKKALARGAALIV